MELIRTLREKRQNAKCAEIEEEAIDIIELKDFDDTLYIAYNGVPVMPIEQQWTSAEILGKLAELRKNYVQYKTKRLKVV